MCRGEEWDVFELCQYFDFLLLNLLRKVLILDLCVSICNFDEETRRDFQGLAFPL